jgi:hypothetical protein
VLLLLQAHLDRLTTRGLDVYGIYQTPMWMASLTPQTGRYPEDDTRPPEIGKRVYRNIDAPRGSSLYWDQPSIVAAHALTAATGEQRYAAAADAYVFAFLDRCVAPNGIFLWGNHYYYDVFQDVVLRFHGEEAPVPVDPESETGELHEIRPIPPAWASFWRIDPAATERAIRAAVRGHLVDPETGEFNRHAAGETGCAFLEAGGILVETLAWLYAQTGDPALLDDAGAMVAYSLRHRGGETGLLENNPTWSRWDKVTSTTEVGFWAGALVRAAERVGPDRPEAGAWIAAAETALRPWLRYGYDAEAQRYYGRLAVADGSPVLGPKVTPYQPGDYSDLWEPLFPTHDYPMPFAEACLSLYRRTGDDLYREACDRWVRIVAQALPARQGRGGYAEHYGRCLHYLLGYADTFDDYGARALARRVAEEALSVLYVGDAGGGMFRGHPGEDRYDAVDGVGFLLLALLRLATDEEPAMMGLGWGGGR